MPTPIPTPTPKPIPAPTPGPTTATADLPGQLRLGVMRLARRLRQERPGELTPSMLSALSVVERHGPLTLGELAAVEQVAPPSMTRIAARLEESGLAVRTADATDRRVARLALSPEGRRQLKEIRGRRDAYLARRLRALTPDEQALLARALPLLERLTGDVP
jgi:DNA-binding MarR family transcriptional regulator